MNVLTFNEAISNFSNSKLQFRIPFAYFWMFSLVQCFMLCSFSFFFILTNKSVSFDSFLFLLALWPFGTLFGLIVTVYVLSVFLRYIQNRIKINHTFTCILKSPSLLLLSSSFAHHPEHCLVCYRDNSNSYIHSYRNWYDWWWVFFRIATNKSVSIENYIRFKVEDR